MKLYNDYPKIKSEAMYKTKQGTGLKILLQRSTVALVQVKFTNFIKFNQTNDLFFVSIKKKYLKVYNNVIKSIPL